MEQRGIPQEEAHLLASLSEGSPGKALALREEIVQIPREDLLKGWLGIKRLTFEETERWTEQLPDDRQKLMSLLDVAKTLLRDLVILKTQKEEARLIHADLRKAMEPIASQWSLTVLLDRLQAIHHTLLAVSPIRGNANTKLALEALMLSWAKG